MGVYFNSRDLLAAYLNGKQISYIALNGQKIWPSIILSCYSNGRWIDEYPWLDNYPWTD